MYNFVPALLHNFYQFHKHFDRRDAPPGPQIKFRKNVAHQDGEVHLRCFMLIVAYF